MMLGIPKLSCKLERFLETAPSVLITKGTTWAAVWYISSICPAISWYTCIFACFTITMFLSQGTATSIRIYSWLLSCNKCDIRAIALQAVISQNDCISHGHSQLLIIIIIIVIFLNIWLDFKCNKTLSLFIPNNWVKSC